MPTSKNVPLCLSRSPLYLFQSQGTYDFHPLAPFSSKGGPTGQVTPFDGLMLAVMRHPEGWVIVAVVGAAVVGAALASMVANAVAPVCNPTHAVDGHHLNQCPIAGRAHFGLHAAFYLLLSK